MGHPPREEAASVTHPPSPSEHALARQGSAPLDLLQILVDLQSSQGCLSAEVLEEVSHALSMPLAQVRGVAEFYHLFSRYSPCRYRVLFADNVIERLAGMESLLIRLCEHLGIDPGKVRCDHRVMVGTTSCIGLSDQGPAALVNGLPITRLDAQRIDAMAEHIEQTIPVGDWPSEWFQVTPNLLRADHLLAEPWEVGAALGVLARQGAAEVLDCLDQARLRGMGGAGFPTASKWRSCRDTPADRRFVVCNADEGEPGTFKDRLLLQSHAHQIIEGMTLCAAIVGANHGVIYLRGEYAFLLPGLLGVLEQARQSERLGTIIRGFPGFSFDISVEVGAGAYVCGEESALLESLEGRRGNPRIRPPYPTQRGYLGAPTVVNNVETFAAAARIVANGEEAYRLAGRGEPGTKLHSVSGDCPRPGIYELPAGTPVRELLELCGAQDTGAVQVGGAAGTLLSPAEFDRRLGFEDLPSTGSFMIFNRRRDPINVVQRFTHFFAEESCGFCTPCRVGTALLRDLADKLFQGRAAPRDLDDMHRISRLLKSTSLCGLGATAPNPVLDLLHRFPAQVQARLCRADQQPAFDLDAALAPARALTGRDD
ncbi:MAG: NAD(P)H-dependent oxidoreductase subunit E [Chromatiales bacterium]|nr:NAD(P)H-dependent oxidoreductase subunit E [Chromatiales bacterium]